jgi:hypothetical protein
MEQTGLGAKSCFTGSEVRETQHLAECTLQLVTIHIRLDVEIICKVTQQ